MYSFTLSTVYIYIYIYIYIYGNINISNKWMQRSNGRVKKMCITKTSAFEEKTVNKNKWINLLTYCKQLTYTHVMQDHHNQMLLIFYTASFQQTGTRCSVICLGFQSHTMWLLLIHKYTTWLDMHFHEHEINKKVQKLSTTEIQTLTVLWFHSCDLMW